LALVVLLVLMVATLHWAICLSCQAVVAAVTVEALPLSLADRVAVVVTLAALVLRV
jgi:hypothetical protein